MTIVDASDAGALRGLYAGGWDPPSAVVNDVRAILDAVRAEGDAALVAFTQRWDDPNASIAGLRVEIPSRKHARTLVPEPIATGLELARERIAEFHARQLPDPLEYHAADLTRYALLSRPLGSVGALVPGGTASLPSSVLMTVVPAKVAGVARVVVVTPRGAAAGWTRRCFYACALTGV